jgi:intracellular septation protein A
VTIEPAADIAGPGADPGVDDVWPPPPTIRSVLDRFGRRFVMDSLVPVVLFLAVNTVAGLAWAIGASMVWSGLGAYLARRAGRRTSPLVWLTLAFVVLKGVAGIATGSELLYFGPAVANNVVIGLAFAISVVVRRPLVGLIAPIFYAFPTFLREHPAYRRIFSRLTLGWAALLLGNGAVQVALLATVSTNTFVLVRALVSWPLTAVMFVVSLRYPRRAFEREPDLADRVAAARAA